MAVIQSTSILPRVLATFPAGIPDEKRDHLIREYIDFKEGVLLLVQASQIKDLDSDSLLSMAQARAMACSGDAAFGELILRMFCGEIETVFADHTESPAELENDKGWDRQQKREYKRALAHHEKAIHLSPRFCLAWINKGIALKNLGRFAEAAATYCHVITEISSGYRKAWQNLGVALACRDRVDLAAVAWARSLDLSPFYPPAMQALRAALDHGAKAFQPKAIKRRRVLFLGTPDPDMLSFDSKKSLQAYRDGLHSVFAAAGLTAALEGSNKRSAPKTRTDSGADVVIVEAEPSSDAVVGREAEEAGYNVTRVHARSEAQQVESLLRDATGSIIIHGAKAMAAVSKYWELLARAHRRRTLVVYIPKGSAMAGTALLEVLRKEGKQPSR